MERQGMVGRPQKAAGDAVVRAAWALFEEVGFEAASMSAVAERAGISRRTLFNHFGCKEALLFPELGEYFAALEEQLLARPREEAFLDSVDHCLGTLTPERDGSVPLPGPRVAAAQLAPEAAVYLRDFAQERLHATALRRFAGEPGAEVKAGLVAAIGAQVWLETASLVRRRGESLPNEAALREVVGHLRDLLR